MENSETVAVSARGVPGGSRIWLAVGLIVVSASWFLLPVDAWLADVVAAAEAAPLLGPALFGAAYILTSLALMPSTIMSLAAGAIWGLWRGSVILHISSIAAEVLMFVVAKKGLQPRFANEKASEHSAILERIDQAFEDDGFLLALLIRWLPFLPTNVVNYLLGTTRLSFRDYFWATFLGTIPNTIVFVYVGALATEKSRGTISGDPVVVATGLVLGVASMVGLMWYARRVIRVRHAGLVSAAAGTQTAAWTVSAALDAVPDEVWDNDMGLFMNRPYLEAAVQTDPRVTWRFGVLRRGDRVVAFVPLQSFEVDPFEHVSTLDPAQAESALGRLKRIVVGGFLRLFNRRVLILGNSYSSGVPGWWNSGDLPTKELCERLFDLMESEAARLPASTLMVKDLVQPIDDDCARRRGFISYDVDPVMEIRLARSWRDFDDYLASLKSRYRSTMIDARELAADVERRELTPAELADLAPELGTLQDEILQRATFCPVAAQPNSFSTQQALLGASCNTVGYLVDGELVGFNTRYVTPEVLYSHVFGVDADVARDVDLYRNIMLDDLEAAIEHGCSVLHLGRTSQSFKSSLGATPASTISWCKHRRWAGQKLIQMAVPYISVDDWTERHPFRADIDLDWRERG